MNGARTATDMLWYPIIMLNRIKTVYSVIQYSLHWHCLFDDIDARIVLLCSTLFMSTVSGVFGIS